MLDTYMYICDRQMNHNLYQDYAYSKTTEPEDADQFRELISHIQDSSFNL